MANLVSSGWWSSFILWNGSLDQLCKSIVKYHFLPLVVHLFPQVDRTLCQIWHTTNLNDFSRLTKPLTKLLLMEETQLATYETKCNPMNMWGSLPLKNSFVAFPQPSTLTVNHHGVAINTPELLGLSRPSAPRNRWLLTWSPARTLGIWQWVAWDMGMTPWCSGDVIVEYSNSKSYTEIAMAKHLKKNTQ